MMYETRTPVDPMTGVPLGVTTRRPVFRPYEADPEAVAEPAAEPAAADALDTDPYPEDGNIAQVLAWVDDAPDDQLRSGRAKAAIVAEHGRGTPRTTLLPQLEERTSPA